jgi:hypothetical protein
MVELTVNNQIFDYPDNGENPGWGEDATEWAQAVTDLLNTLQGANDIPLTQLTLSDGVTDQDVVGLVFNLTQVKQFRVEYFIQRVGTNTSVESGVIYGVWDGTNISISQDLATVDNASDEVGVTLTIDNTGQFKYTSTAFPGHSESIIVFKATTMTI